MRKLTAILVLACVFLEIGGYFIIYQINRRIIKQEVRDYLRHHAGEFNQTEFQFSLPADREAFAALEWEDEREFRFQGEMYDVVELQKSERHVYIRCVRDEQESVLIANFEKIVSGKPANQSSKTGAQASIDFLTNLFPPEEKSDLILPDRIRAGYSFYYPYGIRNQDSDVLTPPPQLSPAL